MFEKAGRNDPCPCGGGLKYKKCCLPKQEALLQRLSARRQLESVAGRKAIDWLNASYEQQVDASIEGAFFVSIDETERKRLDELPPGLMRRLGLNLQDWLLNEGSVEADGQRRPVSELLQAKAEDLGREELECLKAMGTHPLSLYEVKSVKPGEGMELVDLVEGPRESVWIIERTASKKLAPQDIFATRLLAREDGFVMSGAVYPFTREAGLACLDDIRRELTAEGAGVEKAREATRRHVVRRWLKDLVEKNIPAEGDAPADGDETES